MKKILLAKVTSVFGIKGEVKILVYSDNPQHIEKYSLFDDKGNALKLKISNKNKAVVGSNGAGEPILIVKIEGIDDRNKAETLRGMEIFASREDFAKTKKDEFYYVDLIGLDVINMSSQKIGKVTNVSNYGAGGIIEIEFSIKPLPQNYSKVENFSFKNEIFPEVNLETGFLRIDLPDMVEE